MKPGRTATIMIVDDDQIIRDILQIRPKMLGHDTCFMAEDGDAAVRLARETRPDLVFMDISMPGKTDGIAAARTIMSEMDSRIVFLTGHCDPDSSPGQRRFAPRDISSNPSRKRISASH